MKDLMLEEVVDYMVENGIEVNTVNYKLTLLDFIAEHFVQDWAVEHFIINATNFVGE